MKMNMVKKKRPYLADPRFKGGNLIGRLTIINYVGREHNPSGEPGLQHLYEVECECGDESKWFQIDLLRKRVGVTECNECRIARNLKRKEDRKKAPLSTGSITPRNVLSRAWK